MKLLLHLFLVWSTYAFASPADTTDRIHALMTALHQQGHFNGSILVAIGGKVIYRQGFGEANLESHQPFTPETVSCLASLSKPFTAMIIMMLAERKRLRYDDPITNYLPDLGLVSSGITIRHLLTHTSGIPDVGDLGIDTPALTNQKVLETLKNLKVTLRKPGQKYQYSNTGYVLLATIVERITKQDFSDFLRDTILRPLKMERTFLYNGKTPKQAGVSIAYSPFGQLADYVGFTTGMGGMYSTVDDLLLWDQALYTEKLVRQSTLVEAFMPYPVKEGTSTYGFGWNSIRKESHQFVWHTGNTGSFKAFLGRQLPEKIAIIILTNKGNSKRMEINNAIMAIIQGKPYEYPRMSIAEKLYDQIRKAGIQSAVMLYDSLKNGQLDRYDFSEGELNSVGYQLMSERKTEAAIQLFVLNTKVYPRSSNAFDSLAEAYGKAGQKDLAIKYYQKAIELDPSNLNSIQMLKKLK